MIFSPDQTARKVDIEAFLQSMFEPGELVELRGLGGPSQTVRHLSSDLTRLAASAMLFEDYGADVYFTLNPISPRSMYARHHTTERPMRRVSQTARDLDIAFRANYLIDLDPVRASGTAATEAQRGLAASKAIEIESYLTQQGWPAPTVIDSGNGVHLLYKADRCSTFSVLWKTALSAIRQQFGDDQVAVDVQVSNAGRLSRLPGITNRKAGRTASIVYFPAERNVVTEAMLAELISDEGYVSTPVRRAPSPATTVAIDHAGIERLIEEFPEILELHETEERGDATYYHLVECPFAGYAHRDAPGRTAIILSDRTLGFSCFSDDCARHTIADLRRLLRKKTGRWPSMPFWRDNLDDIAEHAAAWGMDDDDDSGEGDDDDPPPPLPNPRKLWIDFETRSETDLRSVGTDNYASHSSTRALLLAYAFDGEPVTVADLSIVEVLPAELVAALTDPVVGKVAWNSSFEHAILRERFHLAIDVAEWLDPMALARYLTFPASLAGCAEALGLAVGKDKRGKALIKLFCGITKSTAKERKVGAPEHRWCDSVSHPVEWQEFIAYCRIDVEVMREAHSCLEGYATLPEHERQLWLLDAAINQRGLPIDCDYVNRARSIMDLADQQTLGSLAALTGCNNSNSLVQLKGWLSDQGVAMESLAEGAVSEALLNHSLPEQVRAALILKSSLSGAGPKKLIALEAQTSADSRLRGQFVYYGGRTGRWTSKGVQVQNLPRPNPALALRIGEITDLVRSGGELPADLDVSDAITSTIRSAFRTDSDQHFVIADYSSIENRVLAWLSNCTAMLAVYINGRDPYKSFAAIITSKDYSDITDLERTQAKPAVLGCGYSMSGPRLALYAETMGIEMSEAEAAGHVEAFRTVYQEIPALWQETEELVLRAVACRDALRSTAGLIFDGRDDRYLSITLPSGRHLYYLSPFIEYLDRGWGPKPSLAFSASSQRGFRRETTYGAKLVENIVQGIARDILSDGLLRATAAGFTIIGHIHDEIISEERSESPFDAALLKQIMSTPPSWATDICLAAKSAETDMYGKI